MSPCFPHRLPSAGSRGIKLCKRRGEEGGREERRRGGKSRTEGKRDRGERAEFNCRQVIVRRKEFQRRRASFSRARSVAKNYKCLVCTLSIKLHVMFGRHGSVLTDRCRRASLIACRLPVRAVLNFARGEKGGRERREEERRQKQDRRQKGLR